MNKKEFAALAAGKIIFLDGATGSNLMKAGMPSGVCPEEWILNHKSVLAGLQREYVEAGADILYAPTFSANRIKLEEYGLYEHQEEMIHALVGLSKEAADGRALVAGDLTMTGEQLSPMGTLTFEELIDIYKEQIRYMADAGVDLLVVETMMSLQETRAALIAAKEVCELPILATMTFEGDGRTLYGTDALTAAVVLESLGADAVGLNCSTGPDKMVDLIRTIAQAVKIPIIAKPNAGLPFVKDGETCYDMNAVDFTEHMKALIEAGATILGGCCGTTPEFIRGIKEAYGNLEPSDYRKKQKTGRRFLTSERQTLSFGLDGNFIIVGERINPTGKKKLQEELRENCFERVQQFAEEQEAAGAGVLDINVGMSGINEKDAMLKAIEEVTAITSLPLAIDSSHVDVLEAALRQYPGRALINSISLEKGKMEKLLPLAKKYGAMFILLPLSDEGLPKNLEERRENIRIIYEETLKAGLCREDIVVDGLVATVGAEKEAALQTLQTIQYCHDEGFATICGLSNISFGMPERSFINSTFLTMAIQSGLTMAIANPSQELLVGAALASDLLLARDNSDIRYIEFAGKVQERKAKDAARMAVFSAGEKGLTASGGGAVQGASGNASGKASGIDSGVAAGQGSASPGAAEEDLRTCLKNAVLKGNRKGIQKITRDALEQGEDAKALLDDVLLPAINLVGDYFDKGTYFLPQLISSAEAMKLSIEVLEEKLNISKENENMPTIVFATVEGDIHDIGKNLVVLMLKNYGFRVIDLGKNVKKEVIVQTAMEHNAALIGLSALMTTTMQRMKEVIQYAKEKDCHAKIMIGGAVITQRYADEIGADGYSTDAADAVRLAKKLLNLT